MVQIFLIITEFRLGQVKTHIQSNLCVRGIHTHRYISFGFLVESLFNLPTFAYQIIINNNKKVSPYKNPYKLVNLTYVKKY